MATEYFNEFIKPLADELNDLLDQYQVPFSEIKNEEACTYCGKETPFSALLWSDDNNPYCSANCLDNNTEEYGKGYKPWINGEKL